LHDPLRMQDMQRAVDRVVRALRDGEHIVVNGDYDTDGITGTSLLVSELRRLGGQVDFFIPDRERDGYGVTPRLVQRAGAVGVKVLLSVDCGSSDQEALAEARALGIDAIVVDHHEIPQVPEAAHAVLNPKRADCEYPFKGLSAVGVSYKLLQAVCMQVRQEPFPEDGLDLVVLGTMGDVQPLVDENRVLTWMGMEKLRSENLRPGLQALLDSSGLRNAAVQSRAMGFRMVPRLNAAGRVARGKLAVDLLLASDPATAGRLAWELELQNQKRRSLSEYAETSAREQAARVWEETKPPALVLASDTWHPGVIGIAAARLAETYGVPVALVAFQNGEGRGSVRSRGAVDARAALEAAAEELVKFGGHREACGFTVERGRFEAFRERFTAAVAAQQPGALPPALQIDGELTEGDLGDGLLEALERLEPFGPGNPEPFFLVRGMRAGSRTRVVGKGHLKLHLEMADGSPLDGIAFGWGRDLSPAMVVGRQIDAVGQLRRQDPRYGNACQLVVADLRATAPQD
jgi:single-stranded-DNA-specific exonuclease